MAPREKKVIKEGRSRKAPDKYSPDCLMNFAKVQKSKKKKNKIAQKKEKNKKYLEKKKHNKN